MIAAIYSRKSTDQTGVADEQKSVARQIEHARAYATSKGWIVDDTHVYVDDGISGAEFANRPGLVRLLTNALDRKGRQTAFHVLIVSDLDRLGREQLETGYVLKQIISAGIRVFSYLDDREIVLDSAIATFMMQVRAFGANLEREKARVRTTDALVRKARAGLVTGGRVYGYDNLRRDTGGVVRVVNDSEAAIVREIFARCARGQGFRTIAHALNDAAAPSPRSQQGRPAGWCPSSIREALNRSLYRGEIVWNRTRKRDAFGKKKQQARPPSEWLHTAAPHLRIVTDDQWAAAHDRLSTSRDTYLRHQNGHVWGKPTNGIESKYLLTGLVQCGVCGSGLYVTSRSHGKARKHFYCCTTNHRKGQSVCPNSRPATLIGADELVMREVQEELLNPDVVAFALREALRQLTAAPEGLAERIDALRRREATIGEETDRLTAAIASGGQLDALVAALKQRDRDRQRLVSEREQLEAVENLSAVDAGEMERDLIARVNEWRAMASRNVAHGRQVLRKLLRGCVRVTPLADGNFEVTGQCDYGKLFSGILFATEVASPTGFEPVFWP